MFETHSCKSTCRRDAVTRVGLATASTGPNRPAQRPVGGSLEGESAQQWRGSACRMLWQVSLSYLPLVVPGLVCVVPPFAALVAMFALTGSMGAIVIVVSVLGLLCCLNEILPVWLRPPWPNHAKCLSTPSRAAKHTSYMLDRNACRASLCATGSGLRRDHRGRHSRLFGAVPCW